jgi:hypothetical protein
MTDDRPPIRSDARPDRRARVQRPRLPARLWHLRHAVAVAAAPGGLVWFGAATNPLEPAALVAATVLSFVTVPEMRRWSVARYRCAVVPHHIRSIFVRNGICADDGRMPAILWTAPTPYGVRVRVRCPIGMPPQRIVDAQDDICAACDAENIVVVREPRRRTVIIGLWFGPARWWWDA